MLKEPELLGEKISNFVEVFFDIFGLAPSRELDNLKKLERECDFEIWKSWLTDLGGEG